MSVRLIILKPIEKGPKKMLTLSCFVVPLGAEDCRVQTHETSQVVLLAELLHVRVDLLGPHVVAAPLGIRVEREGIRMGRHVAGTAGIAVLEPSPANTGIPTLVAVNQCPIIQARMALAHFS